MYRVYGLRVAADRPLPGLLPADPGPADVRVRLGQLPPGLGDAENTGDVVHASEECTADGTPGLTVRRRADGGYYHLRYAEGAEFVVSGSGAEVWGRWDAPLAEADAHMYLLNPVFGFVLRLRGVTAVHGSAVALGGGAVVLLGPSGAGKSTTAAALARRGHPVLADDVVALRSDVGVPVAHPGYAYLRLWPESGALLFGSPAALPALTPTWDKQRLDLDSPAARMHAEPLPLRAVFVLDPREDAPKAPRVGPPLDRSAALLTLVAHVYGAAAPVPEARRRDLETLSAVARAVPVRRVAPHADPARLDALCDRLAAGVATD